MKIRNRLVIVWLFLSIFPLIAASYLFFSNAKKELATTIAMSLSHIAEAKEKQIQWFFSDVRQDLSAIAQGHSVFTFLGTFRANPKAALESKKVMDRDFAALFHEKKFYREILVTDGEGRIRAMVGESDEHYRVGGVLDQELLTRAKQGRVFGYIFKEAGSFFCFYWAPVLENAKFVGVVAMKVSMEHVFSFIQDLSGLGETGETLIATKEGSDIVFMNRLRNSRFGPFEFKVPLAGGQIAGAIQRAIAGETGSGLQLDYRGKPVIAAWRFVPTLNWGLVSKIDEAEAYRPITLLRNLMILIIFVTIFLVILISIPFSRGILAPLAKLEHAAKVVGEGNFDFRIGHSGRDEIGHFARSFDQMIGRLKEVTASRDELDKMKIELERSNRELEQFAYVASHDLQEPLRTIISFGDVISTKYSDKLDEQGQNYFVRIKKASLRMKGLIEALLQYSRVGREKSPMEEVDLGRIFRNVRDDLQARVQSTNGTLEAVGEFPKVTADRRQMHQLFQNLMGNALKFSKPGEPPVVRVEVKDISAGFYEVSIADNGIGFPQEQADVIFEPFRRLHSKEEYEGTGIGLSVVQKIVQRHKGEITVTSSVGAGAVFKFTLPKVQS